ncbi:MAG TPA: hypothetical protein VLI39_07625 [Sedimentisphaerales bacterium]|nr:hypothetical protein [Sedimentisphaerales bacterium]
MATSPVVVPASAKHVAHLTDRLRLADVQEVWNAYHFSPYQALAGAVHGSVVSWALELGREPVAVWGVAPLGTWLSRRGSPWLLASDRLVEASVFGAKVTRHYVLEMLRYFDRLENYVSNENRLSIRWLRWGGFSIGAPEPWGIEGKMFRRFWKEA